MRREHKRYRRLILLVIAVALMLAACSSPSALTPGLEETEVALIDDSAIDAAVLEVATSVEELSGIEAGSVADGEESELLSLEGEDELSSQAVLPGASGFIAYVRHDPNSSKPWEIRLANQATDAKTLVYAGTRQIQSVAASLDGNKLIFAMKPSTSSSNYDIYRLVVSSGAVTRLTSTSSKVENNVSMSANGNTFVWEGTNSSGKRAVFIRQYSGSSFTSKVLSSTVNQVAPSISGDGNYIAFIRRPSSSSYEIMRYNKLNNSYLSVSTSTQNILMHPSVSNGGGKVAWLARVSTGDQVRIKDTVTGNVTTAVSVSGVIEHPHMTADGSFLTYGLLQNSSISAYTMNLSTGQTAATVATTTPRNVYAMYWQKSVSAAQPITITGNITRGSAASSLGLDDELASSSKNASSSKEVSLAEGVIPAEAIMPLDLPNLITKAEREGSVRVIVHLQETFVPEGRLPNQAAVQAQRRRIAQAQGALLQQLAGQRPGLVAKFETIFGIALEVNAAALTALIADPRVAVVHEDFVVYPTLAESTSHIGANAAWTAGYDGTGWTVAVLDTPTQTTHSFLAGKTVWAACFVSDSSCPNGTNTQTGLGSSVPNSAEDHGTHVSGIVLGSGSSFSGVAKGATLMPIKVLSNGSGQWSDVTRGLEHVYLRRTFHNIAAVNMSLGGGLFSSQCDDSFPTMKAAMDNLASVNIATVVSSGNGYSSSGLSAPACISTAISVGSTQDGSNGTTVDNVSDFSNSASFLKLLAPGEWINSSVQGGFANKRGTSMAAPHVAGAWAIIKQKFPTASVADVLSRLETSGDPVLDSRNGITKKRIHVNRALTSTPPPPPPPPPLRVRLINATTGAQVAQVDANSSNQYTFSSVAAGSYYVVAYGDQNNNNTQDPSEMAGAFGSAAVPQVINASTGGYTANITTGVPTEVEPNNGLTTNNLLLLGTVMNGRVPTANEEDFFKLLIPAAGARTMETFNCSGRLDTYIYLYNASGRLLAEDDDGSSNELCSRIDYNFTTPGTYYLKIRGYYSSTGGYTVGIR